MSAIPQNVSASVRKLNTHLYGPDSQLGAVNPSLVVEAKRIRQDSKPLMNKLETEWLNRLREVYPNVQIHSQEWRVKIGNGAWFKVDHCAFIEGKWTAWEVKGPKEGKNVARGLLALKCASKSFPEVEWILVWKQNGIWSQQIVLP